MDIISKSLITIGLILVLLGLIWHFSGGQIPLGRLPGDIRIESEHTKFYFPLTTGLLLSAIFSFIMWLLKK